MNSIRIQKILSTKLVIIRVSEGRDCKVGDLVSKCWILYFKEGNDIHKPIVQFISISLAWVISEAHLTHSRLP